MSGLQLRRVLQAMDDQAGKLFKSGGSRQEIAEALKELADARRRMKENCVSGKDMKEHEEHLAVAKAALVQIDVAIAQTTTELNRLERISAALPKLATRKDLLTRLNAMQGVPLLSEGFSDSRGEAQQENKQANKEKAIFEPEQERLETRLRELADAGRLAPYEKACTSLVERLGACRKGRKDIVELKPQRDACLRDARQILTDVSPGLPTDDVQSLRVTGALKKRIKDLALRNENVFQTEINCRNALTLAAEKAWDARQTLADLRAERDESELERVVLALQKQGDLAKTVHDAQQQQSALAEQAAAALARLDLWSGSLNDLERLPVPSLELVARFHALFEEGATEQKAVEKEERQLKEECARLQKQIERIRKEGAVLTEVELVEAREERDGTWQRIRRVWLGQAPAEEPAPVLAQDYEDQVAAADSAADALRLNAEQVAELADKSWQLEDKNTKLERIVAERDRLIKREESIEAEWHAAWAKVGIIPEHPKDMNAWLNRYAKLIEMAQQARIARTKQMQANREVEAAIQSLNACLTALGEPACAADEVYWVFLERCRAVVAALRKSNQARTAAEKDAANCEKQVRGAQRDIKQAEVARTQWQREWAECMERLTLPSDTPINDADSHLEKLDRLFSCLKDADSFTARINGINKDEEDLQSEVKGLVESIAPDLRGRNVALAIEELRTRCARDAQALLQLQQCREQHNETKKRLDGAMAGLTEADKALAALCQEAGCTDPEQLEGIERRSDERRRLMNNLEQVEENLRTIAKGVQLDKLIEEAEAVDPDALPAQIAAAEDALQALLVKKDENNQDIGRIAAHITALRACSGAAEAAEAAQECLAQIAEKSQQYIKLKLASIVLRKEVKKYQAVNQGPLMARAGGLFNRLTLGSFAGLRIDYSEKDEPFLLGVRPNEKSVPVDGMSDGSRDQLYLSLRLATLERFLDNSEPMPFIVDDILIRFDDERAQATLDVLAELAQRTQVLFFTHHARLFEFAQSSEIAEKVRALTIQS